jgi:lipoprotein-anchoring transpeptidase ErfK/SrfK
MVRGLFLMVLSALIIAPATAGAAKNVVGAAWNASPDYTQTAAGPVAAPAVSSAEVQRAVEQRLRDSLTPEMLGNFGLFIYVSKAQVGPWAQRMYVFQKAGDDLLLLYDWPVSTGRETVEADAQGVELSTTTPAGYYEIDPKRMFEKYRSTQWNEPMPDAMFFNRVDHGVLTGLAIHAATDASQLGTRASAGCVRLSPESAQTLFRIVRDNFKGPVPKLAFDKYSSTTMNNGLLVHGETGSLEMVPGYSALVYIDEYGGENLEARAY